VLRLVLTDALPPRPPDAERGVWRDGDDAPIACTFASREARWVDWPGIAHFAHAGGAETVFAKADTSVSPAVVIDLFNRAVLPALLQAHGAVALHASAIAGPDGVVGFCGRSGTGKSTLACRLALPGRQFADDALVVNFDREGIRAQPLPFVPRARVGDGSTGASAQSLCATAGALSLLFVISRDDGVGRAGAAIERLEPRAAFLSLLPHAIAFESASRESRRRLFDDYSRLVERVPMMSLRYRHAIDELPTLLDDVARAAGLHAPLLSEALR
jgi:hypothetical protein